jgi:uncharacterized membrane protein (UPF0136 family)
MTTIGGIVGSVQSQSLNSVVTGFSFAAAIAWMDVVRWVVAHLIKVNKTDGTFVLLAALLTTILAVVVYAVLEMIAPDKVNEPQQPIYAVVG